MVQLEWWAKFRVFGFSMFLVYYYYVKSAKISRGFLFYFFICVVWNCLGCEWVNWMLVYGEFGARFRVLGMIFEEWMLGGDFGTIFIYFFMYFRIYVAWNCIGYGWMEVECVRCEFSARLSILSFIYLFIFVLMETVSSIVCLFDTKVWGLKMINTMFRVR